MFAFAEKNAYPFRLPPGNTSEFQATGPFALKNWVFNALSGLPTEPGQTVDKVAQDSL